MQQTSAQRAYYEGSADEQPQRPKVIYHIYREEEPGDQAQISEDKRDPGHAPEPEPPATAPASRSRVHSVHSAFLSSLLLLVCMSVPSSSYQQAYTILITRTLTLALGKQVPLIRLPAVRASEQVTVQATGTYQQPARQALGLITFYNGSFMEQVVAAGTEITGKDGVSVQTLQRAIVPPAVATTPPTDGTVSVPAEAVQAGAAGNIAAQDIESVCCGGAVLAQNLNSFSGGQDAHPEPMITQSDIAGGKQRLEQLVSEQVNGQVAREEKPGDVFLPFSSQKTFTDTHQAGDLATSTAISLVETCEPLAYFAPDVERAAQQLVAIPRGYQLVSFSADIFKSRLSANGGTLSVEAIAYLRRTSLSV